MRKSSNNCAIQRGERYREIKYNSPQSVEKLTVYRGRVESEDQWSVTRPTDILSQPSSPLLLLLVVVVVVIISEIHNSLFGPVRHPSRYNMTNMGQREK